MLNLLDLEPETIFLGDRFVNIYNVTNYSTGNLFIRLDYSYELVDVIRFGSTQELEMAIVQLERCFTKAYE